ncbi:MAG TPA: HAD-IIA family hydrolase [Actinomycetota bacterium]|nr:HAD-IIA family hydrolase [Actinomycetota bacterium]
MPERRTIDGVLLDIDGVLTVSWKPLPGAVDTIAWLRRSGTPFLLLSNTTTPGRRGLAKLLTEAGFDVSPAEIVTAAIATASYLRTEHPGERCFLVGAPDLDDDFDGIEFVQEAADVVVVAGADDAFTWPNLNSALQMLRSGASLVAMHRNMTWMTAEGLKLDAGAFLVGLEQAAGVGATVVGKPNADFFRQALKMLRLEPQNVAMVGDDVENDVLAAQRLGLTGVLVRTGKFAIEKERKTSSAPDHVIDSVADLVPLLETLSA